MMRFELLYTPEARSQLEAVEKDPAKARLWRALRKTLGLMETDLRHPSLNTHKYSALRGAGGEEVFEAYAQHRTPGAFRVFWHYGPGKGRITIVAVTPHP